MALFFIFFNVSGPTIAVWSLKVVIPVQRHHTLTLSFCFWQLQPHELRQSPTSVFVRHSMEQVCTKMTETVVTNFVPQKGGMSRIASECPEKSQTLPLTLTLFRSEKLVYFCWPKLPVLHSLSFIQSVIQQHCCLCHLLEHFQHLNNLSFEFETTVSFSIQCYHFSTCHQSYNRLSSLSHTFLLVDLQHLLSMSSSKKKNRIHKQHFGCK